MQENLSVARALPQTPLWELTVLPKTPSGGTKTSPQLSGFQASDFGPLGLAADNSQPV